MAKITNEKSNKNQKDNSQHQDNLNKNDKENSDTNLEDKLYKELENNLENNLDETYQEIPVKRVEPKPTFKNSYTEKLDVASKKREEALKKGTNKYIKYSSIGMEMIGSVLLGGFGGNWLDKKLEFSFPFFTIVLILLGLTTTFAHLIIQLNADRKAEEEEAKKSKN